MCLSRHAAAERGECQGIPEFLGCRCRDQGRAVGDGDYAIDCGIGERFGRELGLFEPNWNGVIPPWILEYMAAVGCQYDVDAQPARSRRE